MIAGIELEDEMEGGLNGWHHGSQLFECSEGRGVFLPFTHFQPDRRFEQPISQFIKSSGATNISDAVAEVSSGVQNLPSSPSYVVALDNEEDLDFGGIECP